jgi:hypothetical protein
VPTGLVALLIFGWMPCAASRGMTAKRHSRTASGRHAAIKMAREFMAGYWLNMQLEAVFMPICPENS